MNLTPGRNSHRRISPDLASRNAAKIALEADGGWWQQVPHKRIRHSLTYVRTHPLLLLTHRPQIDTLASLICLWTALSLWS